MACAQTRAVLEAARLGKRALLWLLPPPPCAILALHRSLVTRRGSIDISSHRAQRAVARDFEARAARPRARAPCFQRSALGRTFQQSPPVFLKTAAAACETRSTMGHVTIRGACARSVRCGASYSLISASSSDHQTARLPSQRASVLVMHVRRRPSQSSRAVPFDYYSLHTPAALSPRSRLPHWPHTAARLL